MTITMRVEGAQPEEIVRGLIAAQEVFAKAGVTPDQAATARFIVEGWDIRGFAGKVPEEELAICTVWDGQPRWREAGVRAPIYVGQPSGVVDERGFEAIRRLRRNDAGLSLQEFKALVRQQFLMLVIDEEAAMAALPGLLPPDQAPRLEVLEMLRSVLAAAGALDDESARRMELVTAIFTPPATPARPRAVASTKTA